MNLSGNIIFVKNLIILIVCVRAHTRICATVIVNSNEFAILSSMKLLYTVNFDTYKSYSRAMTQDTRENLKKLLRYV